MDGAVGIERPAGVVRDFPDISIRISKRSSCTTPVGYGRVPNDRPSGLLSFVQHLGYVLRRVHVVSQLDPRGTVATQGSPQSKDDAASLEEADLVIGLLSTGPAEGFIEASGSGEIRDSKRDQTDALFHLTIMANRDGGREGSGSAPA